MKGLGVVNLQIGRLYAQSRGETKQLHVVVIAGSGGLLHQEHRPVSRSSQKDRWEAKVGGSLQAHTVCHQNRHTTWIGR